MRRWFVTVMVLVAFLANSVWSMRCATGSSVPSVTANTAAEPETPPCHKTGFCPHHANQPTDSKPPADSEKCICSMSPNNVPALTGAAVTPTLVDRRYNAEAVDLAITADAEQAPVPSIIALAFSPDSPPPRA